jgi:Ca-activated chloride channel family protein
VFVVDVSGSMQGKYATLVDGVQRALQKMRPDDRFRIVLFNEHAWELTPGFIGAGPESITHYSRELLAFGPCNGTNLYAGLDLGLQSLEADRTSALVLVTDGVANVGETRQRRFIERIERQDIRLFTFVLGNSANRPLLESLATASNGFAVNVSNSDDIVGQLLAATSKVTHEALHGVKIEIDGVRTADLTPSEPGSLYRGQQLVVFGHYWGDGMADVRLSGRISGEEVNYWTRFAFPSQAAENPEIERLWAYASVEEAMREMRNFGENADLKQAVTDLGVEYGLVTDYTAMVVVPDQVFDELGIERRNRSRRAIEEAAEQLRATRPAVSRRVDGQQPMYSSNRASHSGGGALDPWTLLLLSPLAWLTWWRRRPTSAGQ